MSYNHWLCHKFSRGPWDPQLAGEFKFYRRNFMSKTAVLFLKVLELDSLNFLKNLTYVG